MDRAQKEQTVSALNKDLLSSDGTVLTHNLGLNAADITDLRRTIRGINGHVLVAKNRLIALALNGTKYEGLKDQLTGPTTIVYGDDIYALTKAVVKFAKNNEKLKIVAGSSGSDIMDAKAVEAMSKLPSLNEMRATFIGLLQAPASKMARVLHVYATKEESGEQPAA